MSTLKKIQEKENVERTATAVVEGIVGSGLLALGVVAGATGIGSAVGIVSAFTGAGLLTGSITTATPVVAGKIFDKSQKKEEK